MASTAVEMVDGKLRRNNVEENARSKGKAQDTGICRREGRQRSTTTGSHSNFPKERGPSDQTEVAREISHRRFGDRDFYMQSSLDNENPEIAICDFAI
jgi:hypothetical protein